MSAIHALSQLSYGPKVRFASISNRSREALPCRDSVATLPAPKALEVLSYGPLDRLRPHEGERG